MKSIRNIPTRIARALPASEIDKKKISVVRLTIYRANKTQSPRGSGELEGCKIAIKRLFWIGPKYLECSIKAATRRTKTGCSMINNEPPINPAAITGKSVCMPLIPIYFELPQSFM